MLFCDPEQDTMALEYESLGNKKELLNTIDEVKKKRNKSTS